MSIPPPGGSMSLGGLGSAAAQRESVDHAARASIWPRIGAYLVDAGIAGLGASACVGLTGVGVGDRLISLPYLAFFMVWWLAVRVQGARVAGESPGKRLAGLQVVTLGGEPVGVHTRLLREGPLMLPYLLPFVSVVDALIAEGGERRSVRDRVARTAVVTVPGAAPRRAQMALIVVAASIASILILQPLVSERAGLDRARADMVGECMSNGSIQRATCECIYDRLARRMPKSDLLQAAADRRASMPYDPDVLVALDVALGECRSPSVGGGGSSA